MSLSECKPYEFQHRHHSGLFILTNCNNDDNFYKQTGHFWYWMWSCGLGKWYPKSREKVAFTYRVRGQRRMTSGTLTHRDATSHPRRLESLVTPFWKPHNLYRSGISVQPIRESAACVEKLCLVSKTLNLTTMTAEPLQLASWPLFLLQKRETICNAVLFR